jgi:tRNA-splicing ligase RtcB
MSPVLVEPKLLVWGDRGIEQNTIEQAAKASRLPFVNGHVALMPDAHFGMGSTVGSVIPTQGAVIPAAIGVDIGCGMIAAETDIHVNGLPDSLDKLHEWIAKVVPAGVGQGWERGYGWNKIPLYKGDTKFSTKQVNTIAKQFGTLGSGNHFVEVCEDERGAVWVVLHSGSRGIGNQLAVHHIDIARGNMKQMFITLEDKDLAYLVQGTPEFDAYIADMRWSQDYAAANREKMMDNVLEQLYGFVGGTDERLYREVRRINCHHNYTVLEHHHGTDLWITRKGAIRAREGDWGVIPGSMATGSFIVQGLGNPASYDSASHGAGRRMSRTKARAELTTESLIIRMGGKAWNGSGDQTHYDRQKAAAKSLVDEHPDAYKDIEAVMEAQSDLVVVRHQLTQLLNYKGV